MRKRRWAMVAVAAVGGAIAAELRARLTRYEIAEDSMAPALRGGDYVLVERWNGPPRRGDVVVFPHATRLDLVKRVVGLPGEAVAIEGGTVHVDGAALVEPWSRGPTCPGGTWQLGPDEVFVLGDHRATSAADSRTTGPISVNSLGWQVRFRYWPPSRIGRA